MITLPYTSKSCIKCNKKSGNITFGFNFTDDIYVSCPDCYDYVQNVIIPERQLSHGIVLHYTYYGENNESVFKNSITKNTPKIIRTNNEKTNVSLTSSIKHYIEITDNDIFVPCFFIEKVGRRRHAAVKMYNLQTLYDENPDIIGLYLINDQQYSSNMMLITKHNNKLFNMFIQHNSIAKLINNISKDSLSYFSLLPTEIINIIITFLFKNLGTICKCP